MPSIRLTKSLKLDVDFVVDFLDKLCINPKETLIHLSILTKYFSVLYRRVL